MRKIARRPLWQAGLATALGVLLIGTGWLAACSTTSSDLPTNPANGPANSASLQLASGPTPVVPQPRGNAATGASFGPSVGSLQLPPTPPLPAAVTTAAPPVVGARPTQATGPVMPGVAPTATAAAINVQGQQVLAKPPDVRYRLVYVRADNQLWSVSRAGNDPQVLLAQPTGQEPAGHVTDLNLSPDGNKLLYTVTDGAPTPRVFLLNLADGTLRREPYERRLGL